MAMTDDEIAAYLRQKIDSAQNDEGDEISVRRADNMARYRGDLYGNERPGQSQVVTRECLEAVEWAMPSIVRIFGSSTNALTFEAVGPEDEKQAEQETDVVRHHLFELGNGFTAFHNWAKDALMYPNGYAKVWIDETDKVITERYEGITPPQLSMLTQDKGVEIVGQESFLVDMMGQPAELFNIEVKLTRTEKVLRFEAVPPEEVLVDSDHNQLDLDECLFVAHKVTRTFTWLVNNGFDADRLRDIGGDEASEYEEDSRNLFSEQDDGSDTGALKEYTVYECYAWVDHDGDGVASQRRIVMIGNEIFENEESDYCPLIALSTVMMPHQHTGLSLVDLTSDIQGMSTALTRQLLTNIYRINVPRKYVGVGALVDGGMTMDALLNLESEYIPTENPGLIIPEVIQPIGDMILPVMQQVSEQKMLRTGINPQMSLDPSILKDATKGAFNTAMDHASQRLEMVVRVMAETGVKKAFQKAHRLIREHLGNSTAIKLRNQWIDVNPAEWRERTNIRVRVGVGNQNREEKGNLLMQIMGMQMQAMQVGLPIANPQNLFNTMSELVDTYGFRNAGQFFTDPSTLPPPEPPPPDPSAELYKAQAQALMAEAQAKMAQVESNKQKMEMEFQLKQAELQIKQMGFQAEQMRAQQESEAKQSRDTMEFQMRAAELDTRRGDADLKEAQRVKTLEEARKLDLESDITLAGVIAGYPIDGEPDQ